MLFVGHRGAGKSSELSFLSTLLRERLLSIPIPLYNIFQSPSVSHTEVLLAMNLRLIRAATDESIVPRGLVNQVWEEWLKNPLTFLRELLFGRGPAGRQ